MKPHRTTTLDTAPELRARFNGMFEAGRKVKTGIEVVGERSSVKGRWKAALLKWHKIKLGHISERSVKAIVADNKEKFAYFDKHGGKLPMGL